MHVPPLLMFGFERSGTTLLSMMVGAHPEIAVPLSVTGMWYRYVRRLGEYGSLEITKNRERLVEELLVEERIRLWDVQLNREELLCEPAPRTYAAIIERFHEMYARKKGKPYWGNLDIATLDEMDQANRWFPSARFLHIVRDGRDVALSHETMPYGASNTLEAAETWASRLRVNLKMGAILGPERYMIVRYEDLVSHSETTLQAICRFFGVGYSPAMLDYPRMVEEKVPDDRMWLWPALDKPPDKSKVQVWKTKMSTTKRIVFEGAAGNMLEDLGYEVYDRVPKSFRAYVYELWCFLGRGGRLRRVLSRLRLRRPSRLERSWRASTGKTFGAIQQEAFGSLVRDGVYQERFEHPARLRQFFESCVTDVLGRIESENGLRVLDCGCGPGAWMDVVYRLEKPQKTVDYYGFDLTSEMVDVSRKRLGGRISAANVQQGDILSDASYVFGSKERPFQIVYAFDVVQQLPRRIQLDAVLAMVKHLDSGGCAIVFDHDRWSGYGLRMGFRKLVTRYLGIRLVPDYYCNARYPALSRFAARIKALGPYATEIEIAPDGKKRALFIWRYDRPESVTVSSRNAAK